MPIFGAGVVRAVESKEFFTGRVSCGSARGQSNILPRSVGEADSAHPTPLCPTGMLTLTNALWRLGVQGSVRLRSGESLVTRARNEAVAHFLALPPASRERSF
ncbi:hypothetical protein AWB73_06766 [Caballeronia turbans]|nr:hypothetical protein AWB73_06766 [Caballeronia turbans]